MRSKEEIEDRYKLLLGGGKLLIETPLPLRTFKDIGKIVIDNQAATVKRVTLGAVLGIDILGNATGPMLTEEQVRVQLNDLRGAINEAERRIDEGESVFSLSINRTSLQFAKHELAWVLGEG